MAGRRYEDDFHDIDVLVSDLVRSYKRLHSTCCKLTQEAESVRTQKVHNGSSTPDPPASLSVFSLTPVTDCDLILSKLPEKAHTPRLNLKAKKVTLPANWQQKAICKPLTPRHHFDEIEAEVVGKLESELPRLLQEESCASGFSKAVTASSELLPTESINSSSHEDLAVGVKFSSGSSMQRNTSPASPERTAQATRAKTLEDLVSSAHDSDVMEKRSSLQEFKPVQSLRKYRLRLVRWYWESTGSDLVRHCVEPVMGGVILLNCLLTGVSFDTEDWGGWIVVDWIFAILYAVEICAKMRLLGLREVFCGQSCAWSYFDAAIVIVAFAELFTKLSGSVTLFRVLRLGRLSRLLRLIRLPFLKEFVMLIRGMVGGMRCLLWCLTFLSLPIFIVGMILSQTLRDWDEDGLFSSVPLAMFTTLRCMCGDCSDGSGRPIFFLVSRERGWYIALLYSVFILVSTFGVFNLITAIFIETTLQIAKADQNLQSQIRQAENKKFSQNIKLLVFKLWSEHNNVGMRKTTHPRASEDSLEFQSFNLTDALDLSMDEETYYRLVQKPDIRQILDNMGLDDDDVLDLFHMLDVDQSGTLDLNELVTGLAKLRGEARKRDLVGLAYLLYSVQDSIRDLNTAVTSLCQAQNIQEKRPSRQSIRLNSL